MPDYPEIPAGYAVPLVDTATDLLDAATMSALDARYTTTESHFVLNRTAAYNFTTIPGTAIAWGSTPAEGALTGFSTSDDITFTCTEDALYLIDVMLTAMNTAGAVVLDLYKNGAVARTMILTSTATTSTSLHLSMIGWFEVGDTFKVHARASTTIAGNVAEQANYLSVARLHT